MKELNLKKKLKVILISIKIERVIKFLTMNSKIILILNLIVNILI